VTEITVISDDDGVVDCIEQPEPPKKRPTTTLAPQQEEAVRLIRSRITGANPEKLTYLAGYAGTGKSTILPFILDDAGINPNDIAFVAPTGKAAKVMRTKLKAQGFTNWMATTYHSAIYRARPAPIAMLEGNLDEARRHLDELIAHGGQGRELEFLDTKKMVKRLTEELENAYSSDKPSFQLNMDCGMESKKLIVVDEGSMVGVTGASDLMYWGVPILVMGDPGQLPPVEEEPGLTCGTPDYFLTEIHRQALDNPILEIATMAREGKQIPEGVYGDGRAVVIKRSAFNDGHFDWREPAPKFIVGANKTRWAVTKLLRSGYLGEGAERLGPRTGEPMIVRKNSRQYPNLVNGSDVTAVTDGQLVANQTTFTMSFEDEDGVKYTNKCFQGHFEEHFSRKPGGYSTDSRAAYRAKKNSVELDWGWAITCHKAQGSQYDDVVVIDESGMFREDSAKWKYTAVTRAAEQLTLLV
jgi:exodeoxyribonuclease-5